MKVINIEWKAEGQIDTYNIYRSETRLNTNYLPTPIATGITSKNFQDTYTGDSNILYYIISSKSAIYEKFSPEVVVNFLQNSGGSGGSGTDGSYRISCDGAISEIIVAPFSATSEYLVTINGTALGLSLPFISGGIKDTLQVNGVTLEGLDSNNNVVNNSSTVRARFKNNEATSRRLSITSPESNRITQNLTSNNQSFGINGLNSKEVMFCLSGYVQEIMEFDYAVLRYIWTSVSGKDMDTRTLISNPSRNVVVGWSRNTTDGEFLKWGGDNTGSGVEAVLLDVSKLRQNYPSQTSFEVLMRSFWFSSKVTGEFVVEFESYKGGTMTQNGYDFINSGGVSVQKLSIDCYVNTVTGSDIEGDLVAVLNYDANLKTGVLSANRS